MFSLLFLEKTHSSVLPVQAKVESFDGDQIDVDDKATSVIDNCLSASVDSAKLFEQALAPSTCKNCTNIIADTNSKEIIAAQVKIQTRTPWFLFLDGEIVETLQPVS